jgi:hypothetical protein
LKPKSKTIPNSCQNLTEINQKKIPKKNYSPSSLFLLQKTEEMRVYQAVVVVVWAKPQVEVEVVADEEGGGGLGSGRHHFGSGFCWRKMWFIENCFYVVYFLPLDFVFDTCSSSG